MLRKIIHVDIDAFYASIEQRDHPEYRGKPLAVGHAAERGVVAAASYEARKWGIHSAMPSLTALARCPDLIFVPTRFDVYQEVSRQIRELFLEYTDLVEPLSLDEAYLDVTVNKFGIPSATAIARDIRKRIREATGLTASAGVSVNKLLAKIASDWKKPDGLFVVLPEEAEAFVEALKIEQFWGVGRVTAEKMHRLGIHTGSDLKRLDEAELLRLFGKAGHMYYLNARGIDDREVVPDRIRKSLGAETTFMADLDDREELTKRLWEISKEVWNRRSRQMFIGRTVTLKVKYADFREMSRRRTLPKAVRNFRTFWTVAKDLLNIVEFGNGKKIRLIGLTVSNAEDETEDRQLRFDFGDEEEGS
ncbi:MAG: DNA polymerase IV [Synergistaceae bacterium]|jgi:DNA polymerase-4|nr:DNA polymerase IV [Synergistaceae bacterium]